MLASLLHDSCMDVVVPLTHTTNITITTMGDNCKTIGEVDIEVHRKYDIKKRIGKGAYGIVWQAVNKQTGQMVAVKKIFDAFRNRTDAQRTYREVMFLRQFGHHPNIIKLSEIMRADNNLDLYLILEYMDSDLHQVIKRGNLLKDIHIRYIMFQLFRALKCLHLINVIHRDQKPSNILLDSDCRVRVADFGLARSLTQLEEDDQIDPSLTEYVATRWYRAPEILLADKTYTTGVDMWSAGCILGEMLLGKPLFPGTSTLNQIERIMSAIRTPTRQDINRMCSGYALSVLERASNRPKRTLKEMLPMASEDAVDLLDKLLVFNPERRLSAEQALQHPYFNRFNTVQTDRDSSFVIERNCVEDPQQLSVGEYRQKLYQLIEDNQDSGQNRNEKAQDNDLRANDVSDVEDSESESFGHTKQDEIEPELADISTSSGSSTSDYESVQKQSRNGFQSTNNFLKVTNSSSRIGSSLRKTQSQECVQTPTPKMSSFLSKSRTSLTTAGFVSSSVAAAGLPSHHPRANTASAWLRYHTPAIIRQDYAPETSYKKPSSAMDRLKANYGRKQFGNHSNVSSLGSPKLLMNSYTQSHGTISASAMQQLRISK